MNHDNLCLYLSGKFTGRPKHEIIEERKPIKAEIIKRGWTYVCPFEKEEGLFKTNEKCSIEKLKQEIGVTISLDKHYIKDDCQVLLYLTGDTPSCGSLLEVGYARYHLVKPIVTISPLHASQKMTTWLTKESDYIAPDYIDALDIINERWGTREKRLIWTCNLLAKHSRGDEVKKLLIDYFKSRGALK
jgi:hypothetical protein